MDPPVESFDNTGKIKKPARTGRYHCVESIHSHHEWNSELTKPLENVKNNKRQYKWFGTSEMLRCGVGGQGIRR